MIIERLPYELRQVDNVVLFDDFTGGLDTTNKWGTVLSSSVTAAAAGGVVTLATNGSANDEAYLYSKQTLFQPRANKNCYLEGAIQYAEQNGNFANVAFGLMSGVATGAFGTAGGGLRATGTFIGIYKKSGDTAWRARVQNGASAVEDVSSSPCGLTTYTTLGIEIMMQMGTVAEIAYRVDGALLRQGGNTSQFIKHSLDLSGLTAAQLAFLLRAGSTNTTAEFANVDYLAANIVR